MLYIYLFHQNDEHSRFYKENHKDMYSTKKTERHINEMHVQEKKST